MLNLSGSRGTTKVANNRSFAFGHESAGSLPIVRTLFSFAAWLYGQLAGLHTMETQWTVLAVQYDENKVVQELRFDRYPK
jgi:hypothetical protein